MQSSGRTVAGVLLVVGLAEHVSGHGRLMDPPARNALWRFGFPNPVNYNDNELFCGGFVVQYNQNKGKCGVCGDNYAHPVPRPHEAGGKFARGIIGKRYAPGQLVTIEAELTANHMGNFVIRLCPLNNDKETVTQECLNRYVLKLAGTNSPRFIIPEDAGKAGIFHWQVELPPYLTCTQCVMQWTYYAGNTWGTCSDGEQAVGCGPQETFTNCADVAIISNTAYFGPVHSSLHVHLPYTKTDVVRVSALANQIELEPRLPPAYRPQTCIPLGQFANTPNATETCIRCLGAPAQCDMQRCTCITECKAKGTFAARPQGDLYCHQNCLGYPSYCPDDKCKCN